MPVVLFDMSIRIPRVRAYIKFFTLATVAALQDYLIIKWLR